MTDFNPSPHNNNNYNYNNNKYYKYMPARTANVTEDVYTDIHKEMNMTKRTYSFVVNRRLEKLMEIEKAVIDIEKAGLTCPEH